MTIVPYRELAARCRDASSDDRVLEGEIFRSLHAGSSSDGRWSNQFGDDVWHRESDEHGVWEGPPHYLGSIDDALKARLSGMKLTGLVEREKPDAAGVDWRPCRAEIAIATTDGRTGAVVVGEGHTLAGAVTVAVLLAHDHFHYAGRD